MISTGWQIIPLHQIAEVRTGVAKGKQGLKEPISVPYIRVANVQDGNIDLREIKYIEVERAQLDRYLLETGDVLMTEGGDFDKLGRGDVWQGQIHPCLHQNHVFAVRPDGRVLDSIFLAALSSSHYGKSYFLSCAKRSTNLASINATQVKNFPVLLPKIEEQRAIVKTLSIWDAAINCVQKLLENSKQQKKALMQQLLTGKQRLPGFSKEWTKYTLKEMGTFTKGSGLPKEHLRSTGELYAIPYTSIFTDFKEVFKESDISKYVNRSHEGLTTRNKACLLFASSSNMLENIGKCAGYTGKKEVAIGGDVIIFDTAQNISFLAYLFARRCHRNNFLRLSQGSTIRHLYPHQLEMYQVFMPPLPEQTAIVQVLSAAEAVIGRYEIKLANLQSQKKVLMQQLLTGKKRVILHDSQEACQ